MSQIELKDHKTKIAYLNRVVGQTLTDYKTVSKDGGNIYYNLDFSLLCPLLFKRPSEGSNDFLEPVKQWMQHVLSVTSGQTEVKLIMSAATLYEFYDQMNHYLESLKANKPKLMDYYYNKKVNDDTGITTDEIRRNLLIFSNLGYSYQVLKPVNDLLRYFDDNIICGIGDYFEKLTPSESKLFESMTEAFLQQHLKKRYNAPNNKRDFENSQFHFRMDAINNALSVILAHRKGHTPLFVTPTPLNHEQCIFDNTNVGRQDRVPLFYLNMEVLKEKGYFPDPLSYLIEAFRESSSLEKELTSYDEMSKVPYYIKQKIEAFYKMYAGPLASHSSLVEDVNINEVKDEISSVLSSRKKMSEIIDRALDDIRLSAMQVDQYANRIDTSYLYNEQTLQDPILQKLQKELLLK